MQESRVFLSNILLIFEVRSDSMLPSNYAKLPIDLSGSRAKNRFRFEMLWGIYRLFEIYDKTDDFVAIFDCVCDVEIFTDTEDSYYQVKTKKETQPYTVNALCKTRKGENDAVLPSILGKLFLIKAASEPQRQMKVAVVANVGFKHKKKEYTESLEFPLATIDEDAKQAITDALRKEQGNITVDLDNVYYIRSYMDLAHPKESLIGKMATWFADNKGCEIKNPQALYLALCDIVQEKASFEWNDGDPSTAQEKKGISKQQFDNLIEQHTQNAVNGIDLAKEWITQNITDYMGRLEAMQDLATIVQYQKTDNRIKLIIEIVEGLITSRQVPQERKTEQQVIDYLQEQIQDKWPADYSRNQMRMFILVNLKRMEEMACQF